MSRKRTRGARAVVQQQQQQPHGGSDDDLFLDDDDDDAGLAAHAPQLGAPVLPHDCGLSEAELRRRLDQDVPEESAQEYLARVRLVARAIPFVVVAPAAHGLVPPAPAPAKQEHKQKQQKPAWTVPSAVNLGGIRALSDAQRVNVQRQFARARAYVKHWEDRVETVAGVRQNLQRVDFPMSLERTQWMDFFFKQGDDGVPPLLHVLLQMDHVMAVRALRHLVRAFELDGVMDHRRSGWVFALLTKLECPYTDDVGSMLRNLHRLLGKSLVLAGESQRSGDHEVDPRMLLQVIVADLGQGDDAGKRVAVGGQGLHASYVW